MHEPILTTEVYLTQCVRRIVFQLNGAKIAIQRSDGGGSQQYGATTRNRMHRVIGHLIGFENFEYLSLVGLLCLRHVPVISSGH